MTSIKNFCLCIVMLSFFHSYAMESADNVQEEKYLEYVTKDGKILQCSNVVSIDILKQAWDKIDKDYVGVSDCMMSSDLRACISSCLSVYKSYYITPQEAEVQLSEVLQSLPSYSNKEFILNKLVQNHWYMHYLMQTLVNKKEQDITGLNIDALHNAKNLDSIVLSYIYKKNCDKKLIDIMPQVISGMHFTVLRHPHGYVKQYSLVMSSNNKYLRATSYNNKYAMWDMETGDLVENLKVKKNKIKWTNKGYTYTDYSHKQKSVFGGYSCSFVERHRVVDRKDQYCAMVINPDMVIDEQVLPEWMAHDCDRVLLFKRPQSISHFCQKAFENSYTKSEELKALLNSKAVKSIPGFPLEKFRSIIARRLYCLSMLTAQKSIR